MGHIHGRKWDDKSIIEEIQKIVISEGMETFPTHSEMQRYESGRSLCCAISKHGGTHRFAKMMGLPIKPSESKFGEKYEIKCCEDIAQETGLHCEKMQIRYAYDVLVEGSVKVDVKSARLYRTKSGAAFYTFNLGKKKQTCDIYVCYCIGDDDNVCKAYVVPSISVHGNKQLSIGKERSKYDRYKSQWHFISDYYSFMKKLQ